MRFISPDDFQTLLRPRPKESHKGTCGHLLIIGGSVNRLGAPLLTAKAALRSGAGLVTVALPEKAYRKIPKGLLEVMYEPLSSWSLLRKVIDEKQAIAVGPGLGVTPAVRIMVLRLIRDARQPLVMDADALNVLGTALEVLKKAKVPVILTPHPGEMGRLLGRTTKAIQADRLSAARECARRSGAIVVLKGFHSIVMTPSGKYHVNPTGNPGMATAGMGDVLTGMIGALVAGTPGKVLEATLAAVYLHGLAGDRVARRLGDRGLLSSDVIEEIASAFGEMIRA